jgi:SAM-dependent methyltransferase
MNDHEYALMRRVEDSYWWYAVLRESVANQVAAHLGSRTPARVLDAGCGTGGMMEVLRGRGPGWEIVGLDYSPHAIGHTRGRGFTNVSEGSINALPYADQSFDVVVSLDVLYFEGVNDVKAIAEFHRVLKPGGMLVLNLPAFAVLRGEHDRAVSGVRRYTPFGVREMLAQCNMEVVRVHCWNLCLFFPILGWRLLSRMRPSGNGAAARSDLSTLPVALNKALATLGRFDMAMCRAIHSPLGTSVQAVATRRRSS